MMTHSTDAGVAVSKIIYEIVYSDLVKSSKHVCGSPGDKITSDVTRHADFIVLETINPDVFYVLKNRNGEQGICCTRSQLDEIKKELHYV